MATHPAGLRIFFMAITFICSFAYNSRKELRTKEMNQDEIIQLSHTVQPNSIDPSHVVQLSWQPRVFLYRGFLSEEECDHLISWVQGKSKNSTRSNDMNNVPDIYGVPMDVDDELARRIDERISAWTFLPKENSKPLAILHFGAEDAKKNYTYFDDKSSGQVDQPLLATIILYLSYVSQGGQILFPQSKNHIWSDCTKNNNIYKHSKGNAIVFFNQHLDATPDESSSHARCPVLQGDMWCATKFFYLNDINAEKDLLRSDDPGCTDEDENCPSWAAIGECERNALYMVGSPDYYGTCRKSCNAC